jgi:hypothetical protein
MSILKFVCLFASTQIKSIIVCELNPTDSDRCHDFIGNVWFITQWHKILTDRHDITEMLLKVALNTETLTSYSILVTFVDDRKVFFYIV